MGMIHNYFVFDNRNSRDWKIGLSGSEVFNAPARVVEEIRIPGKNGSLFLDDGSFENIFVTYPCWIAFEFMDQIGDFRSFLLSHSDKYYRLENTYAPDEYRMARYEGPFTATPGTMNRSGHFDVVFNCDPRRFLKTGLTEFKGVDVIFNPTRFPAKPLVRISEFGSYQIGTGTISVTQLPEDGYLDIDTEEYTGMCEGVDYPSYFEISSKGITLEPGENTVTQSDDMIIFPRWWTI